MGNHKRAIAGGDDRHVGSPEGCGEYEGEAIVNDKQQRNAMLNGIIGVFLLILGVVRISSGDAVFGWVFLLAGVGNLIAAVVRFRQA